MAFGWRVASRDDVATVACISASHGENTGSIPVMVTKQEIYHIDFV
jgi:hypothetical protein